MNKSDVARAVREIAQALIDVGDLGPNQDLYAVNPMWVFNRLERERPDVVAHLRRNNKGGGTPTK